MPYTKIPDFKKLTEQIELYAQLKSEYGASGIHSILSKTEKNLRAALSQIKKLPNDSNLSKAEPDNLLAIKKLRNPGPRHLFKSFDNIEYQEKLEGALLGRMGLNGYFRGSRFYIRRKLAITSPP